MDRTVNSATAQQTAIGGVDDRADGKSRNVATVEPNARMARHGQSHAQL
jgi:hypothetical protein